MALSGLGALALGATFLGWSARIDVSNASGADAGVLLSATPVVQVATNATYGNILTTNSGRALYTLDTDHNGLSTCTGSCLSVWPALTVPAGTTPTGGSGVTGTVGASLQSNGTFQVTYNGSPVSTFIGDTAADEVTGQNVNGFSVVNVASTTTTTTTSPTTTTTTPGSSPPAAPTGVRAVSESTVTGSGSLKVSYTAGTNNGSAITKFTATCTSSDGGATRTAVHAGSTAAPITVSGVTTKKRYACKVTATNADGTSRTSAPSNAVVVGAPAAPTGVHPVRVGVGEVKVNFSPGANNGAKTMGYTAVCVSSNGGVTKTGTRTRSPITVTGLTRGKAYTCTVKATNRRGTGPSSAASPPLNV